MVYAHCGFLKIIIFLAACMVVVTALPRLSPVLYPPLPAFSDDIDCDDVTLHMYRHFQEMGIDTVPVIGNLAMNDEEYAESDHVWLIVKSGEHSIAYDWGEPRFDRQHYEGYSIDLDTLLHAVAEDGKDIEILTATGIDY